jgi:hypothetical protein
MFSGSEKQLRFIRTGICLAVLLNMSWRQEIAGGLEQLHNEVHPDVWLLQLFIRDMHSNSTDLDWALHSAAKYTDHNKHHQYELGPKRPVLASSASLFKGLSSRLRSSGLLYSIFGTLLLSIHIFGALKSF